MEGLDACLRKQIDIRSFDELRWLDAELRHERPCFSDTNFGWFTVFEDNLEFQELTEVSNSVQMHASSADKKQGALLHNAADLTVGEAQCLPQRFRTCCGCDDVEGLLRPLLIRTAIEDELAFGAREGAQLQTTGLTAKERIVLLDIDGTFARKRGSFR